MTSGFSQQSTPVSTAHFSGYYSPAGQTSNAGSAIRGRSQTDSLLHTAFSSSVEATPASGSTSNEGLAVMEAHKAKLYELFALIEKEFDALALENISLRSRLEGHPPPSQQHSSYLPLRNYLQERMSIERNIINTAGIDSIGTSDQFSVQNSSSVPASSVTGEQLDGYRFSSSSKKLTQAARQKWKGRLVTSLKSQVVGASGGGNLLADASSKHRFVQNFKGHSDGVWHVAAAMTGAQTFVVASASADQTAKIWSAEDGKCLLNYIGHTGSVNSVAIRGQTNQDSRISSDQLMVMTTSGDRSAHIWKANLGIHSAGNAAGNTIGGGNNVDSNEYDSVHQQQLDSKTPEDLPDGHSNQLGLIPSTSSSHHPLVVQQPLIRLTGHTDVVVAGEWLFGGEQVITASWDRTANVYDAETGKIVNTLSGHDQELTHCNAHGSQKLVATASKDFTFRLWDFREPIQSVAVFQGHNDAVTSVVFTSFHHIISASDDRSAKVWDLRNMRSPISAIRLNSSANRLSVCNRHNLIAIPQDGRHISIYDLHGMRLARLPRTNGKCHHRMVCCTTWLSDHPVNNLISCGFDRQIIGWKIQVPTAKA